MSTARQNTMEENPRNSLTIKCRNENSGTRIVIGQEIPEIPPDPFIFKGKKKMNPQAKAKRLSTIINSLHHLTTRNNDARTYSPSEPSWEDNDNILEPSIQLTIQVKDKSVSNHGCDSPEEGLVHHSECHESDRLESIGNILEPIVQLDIHVKDEPEVDLHRAAPPLPESAGDIWRKRGRPRGSAKRKRPGRPKRDAIVSGSSDVQMYPPSESSDSSIQQTIQITVNSSIDPGDSNGAGADMYQSSEISADVLQRKWRKPRKVHYYYVEETENAKKDEVEEEEEEEDNVRGRKLRKRVAAVSYHDVRISGYGTEGRNATKKFPCSICRQNFSSLHSLRKHRLTHAKDKTYVCTVCHHEFRKATEWSAHMRTHDPGLVRFPCSQCANVYQRYGSLQRHEYKEHHGVLPGNAVVYPCSTCGLCYYSPAELKAHQYKHAGERHFACNDCDKRFTSKAGLLGHLLIHQDVKPIQCKMCGKHFRQASSFRKHQAVHISVVKHYDCKNCSMQFIRQFELRRHECRMSQPGRENTEAAVAETS